MSNQEKDTIWIRWFDTSHYHFLRDLDEKGWWIQIYGRSQMISVLMGHRPRPGRPSRAYRDWIVSCRGNIGASPQSKRIFTEAVTRLDSWHANRHLLIVEYAKPVTEIELPTNYYHAKRKIAAELRAEFQNDVESSKKPEFDPLEFNALLSQKIAAFKNEFPIEDIRKYAPARYDEYTDEQIRKEYLKELGWTDDELNSWAINSLPPDSIFKSLILLGLRGLVWV